MRSITLLLAALCLVLPACSGGGGGGGSSDGPLSIRVVAGNRQTVKANRDSLFSPVVAQVTRGATSGLALRLVSEANAQTSVRGVPNQQVCAVGVGDNPLVAWNPCALTDAQGNALFFFNPPTKAGETRAEVRAVINGQPVVTDSVIATVEPGPAITTLLYEPGGYRMLSVGPVVIFNLTFDPLFSDAYHNLVDYRAHATGFLKDTTYTRPNDIPRMALKIVGDSAAVGDTATVRFTTPAGAPLADTWAEVTQWQRSASGDIAWGIRLHLRSFTPSPSLSGDGSRVR